MYRYLKATPTTYVIHHRGGRVRREGAGLSFWYWAPTSTLIAVPLSSVDAPFAFQEVTADFQTLTLQGNLTYRVADPRRLAGLLDFSIHPDGRHRSEDPQKLEERLVHATQVHARAETQRLSLQAALLGTEGLGARIGAALKRDEQVATLGVEILGLSLLSVKATPEMARALEADSREALHRRADEAIYARRNAAVEQERKIKESELSTEIAVEEKKRQVRETKMAADIAVETERARLVDQRVDNDRKEADSRAYALEASMKPLRQSDWRTLMAVASGSADPKTVIALAFQELAANAQKIGELNVSPDLLESLTSSSTRQRPAAK